MHYHRQTLSPAEYSTASICSCLVTTHCGINKLDSKFPVLFVNVLLHITYIEKKRFFFTKRYSVVPLDHWERISGILSRRKLLSNQRVLKFYSWAAERTLGKVRTLDFFVTCEASVWLMPCLANHPMHTAYGTLETFSWVSVLFIKFLVVYIFVSKCFKTRPSHPLMKTHNKYFLSQGWGIIFWNILKFLSLVFICSEFHSFICSFVNVFESFTFVFTQGNTILT